MPETSLRDILIEEAREFRKSERFDLAFSSHVAGILEASSKNYILQRAISDEGMVYVATFMLWCHFFGGEEGLTISRIQLFATSHSLASTGRVAAFMTVLRYTGLLAPAASSLNRRSKRLVFSANALALARKRYAPLVSALAVLLDEPRLSASLSEDEALLADLAYGGHEVFGAIGSLVNLVPGLRLFTNRASGYEMLLRLTDLHNTNKGAISFAYGEIAEAVGASRAHVRRLMVAAEEGGFVSLLAEGGRQVHLNEAGLELAETFVALEFSVVHQGIKRYRLREMPFAGEDVAAANHQVATPTKMFGGDH